MAPGRCPPRPACEIWWMPSPRPPSRGDSMTVRDPLQRRLFPAARRRLALAAALLVCALPPGPARAQAPAMTEAARKEGKVVWYTSLALPSAEKVAKLFEAAYPGITVEVHRTGSQRILQRVMQELQAGIKTVDVI